MKKIFTYYEPVEELDRHDELDLIELWKQRWSAEGWQTEVLNESAAKAHPFYDFYAGRVSKLKSVNPGRYDYHCFMRWLAMAGQSGGMVVMSDYDVMPYRFSPVENIGAELCFYQKHVPSLVSGHPHGFLAMAIEFSSYVMQPSDTENGRPHISDMHIVLKLMEAMPRLHQVLHVVRNYTEDGWKSAPAVHYSNNSMRPSGLTPRAKHIPTLR